MVTLISACYCCSVTQSCLTLCNSTNCSMPGLPVFYHLPELAQIHVHWVSDAIQPSCQNTHPKVWCYIKAWCVLWLSLPEAQCPSSSYGAACFNLLVQVSHYSSVFTQRLLSSNLWEDTWRPCIFLHQSFSCRLIFTWTSLYCHVSFYFFFFKSRLSKEVVGNT